MRAGLAGGVVEVGEQAEGLLGVLDRERRLGQLEVGVAHRGEHPGLALAVAEGAGRAEVLERQLKRLVVVALAHVDRREGAQRERPAREVAERLQLGEGVGQEPSGRVVVRQEVPRKALVGLHQGRGQGALRLGREGLGLGHEREDALGLVGHGRHRRCEQVRQRARRQVARGEPLRRSGRGRADGGGVGHGGATPCAGRGALGSEPAHEGLDLRVREGEHARGRWLLRA